jgi:hydroxypyruvate reductase
MEAAHPVPDQSSLDAGLALRDFVAAVPPADTLLLLVSGGASSLVEVPRQGISLRDVQRLNRFVLGSGLDIHRCNALRKTLSRIKGGGLLDYFQGRDLLCLLISDVPGDDPAVIGSGLVVPGDGACSLDGLPDWVVKLASRGGNPAAARARAAPRVRVLASNFDALQAASEAAKQSGLTPAQPFGELSGDAGEQGRAMGRALRRCRPGLYLWGGETTVRLPPRPGRGGRNQHLALALAGELGGDEQVAVLVGGSDGNDGDGPWAGAIVDGGTRSRGEAAGMDLEHCMANADSGRFLEASGDLLWTGATGTNVCDLAIALVGSPPRQLR